MPRKNFENDQQLIEKLKRQEKLSLDKRRYEAIFEGLPKTIQDFAIQSQGVKDSDKWMLLRYFLHEQKNESLYIEQIELKLKNKFGKKAILKGKNIKDYVLEKTSMKDLQSTISGELISDLAVKPCLEAKTKLFNYCVEYLEILSKEQPTFSNYLNSLIISVNKKLKILNSRSDVIEKYKNFFKNQNNPKLSGNDSVNLYNSLVKSSLVNDLIETINLQTKDIANDLTNYVKKAMNLNELNLISDSLQLSEAYQHVENYYQKEKEKIEKFLSENTNEFIFLEEEEKEFSDALENGNLKKLLKLRKAFPSEYNNELKLQQDFGNNLKEKFKANFLQAITENKLEVFVKKNLGEEIVKKFNKDKKGNADFQTFVKKISSLEEKDDFIDKILDIFYELISFVGFEKKMQNSSKERLYSNIIKIAEDSSAITASVASNKKDKPPKLDM